MISVYLFASLATLAPPGALPRWQNACDVTDPVILGLMDSEVFLLQRSQLSAKKQGFMMMNTLTQYLTVPQGSTPLAVGSPFRGEVRPIQGRSGVLVGPDLVLTAPHAAHFNLNEFYVVRGMSSRLVNGQCQPADWTNIPVENVFETVEEVANTYSLPFSPHYDLAVLRLDRPTGAPYLAMRTTGTAWPGAPVVTIGHPGFLSTKVSPDGALDGIGADGTQLMYGIYSFVGSSGSMVYNLQDQVIETVIAYGGPSCAYYVGNPAWLDPACAQYTFGPNRPLVEVAPTLSGVALRTRPLGAVRHIAAVNGTPTGATTSYTFETPPASGQTHWRVDAPPAATDGGPALVVQGRGEGWLGPNASSGFDALAGSSAQCGTYTRTIEVHDLTHGFTDRLRHVFEVGLTEFAREPATGGFDVASVVAPYTNAHRTFTLRNPRPTPVTVKIEGPAWLEATVGLGLPTALPQFVTLGSSGAATVTFAPNPAAMFTPGLDYTGEILLANQQANCRAVDSRTIPVRFSVGRERFETYAGDTPLPPGTGGGYGNVLSSELVVPDGFVVDSVRFGLSVTEIGSIGRAQLETMRIALVAPDGTRVELWNSHAATPVYVDEDSTTFGGSNNPGRVLRLMLDDATAPPPTGQLLGTFAGHYGAGGWRVEVRTTLAAGVPRLYDWQLTIAGHPLPCTTFCEE